VNNPWPATKRDALLAVCSLAPPLADDRACAWCAAELPPRRRSWCSDRCGELFWANHWWSVARTAAKRRDRYRCRRCGARAPKRPARTAFAKHAAYLAAMRAWRKEKLTSRLEVNHIVPCRGKHRALDCAHHQENLETLCPQCHKVHTSALRPQARARAVATLPSVRAPVAPKPRRSVAKR
jgi:5-methylcytosine-specific restriction endonuclease McrA